MRTASTWSHCNQNGYKACSRSDLLRSIRDVALPMHQPCECRTSRSKSPLGQTSSTCHRSKASSLASPTDGLTTTPVLLGLDCRCTHQTPSWCATGNERTPDWVCSLRIDSGQLLLRV